MSKPPAIRKPKSVEPPKPSRSIEVKANINFDVAKTAGIVMRWLVFGIVAVKSPDAIGAGAVKAVTTIAAQVF